MDTDDAPPLPRVSGAPEPKDAEAFDCCWVTMCSVAPPEPEPCPNCGLERRLLISWFMAVGVSGRIDPSTLPIWL